MAIRPSLWTLLAVAGGAIAAFLAFGSQRRAADLRRLGALSDQWLAQQRVTDRTYTQD